MSSVEKEVTWFDSIQYSKKILRVQLYIDAFKENFNDDDFDIY